MNRSSQFRRPAAPIEIPADVAARAATQYAVDAAGCWISTYSVGSHGYAQIGWNRAGGHRGTTTAHRAAYVHHHGQQIPSGATVDHLCKQRQCVRPDHLRLLTNFENARRTSGRDWPLGECANGHPNSQLHKLPSGRWVCPPCVAASRDRHRRKKTN